MTLGAGNQLNDFTERQKIASGYVPKDHGIDPTQRAFQVAHNGCQKEQSGTGHAHNLYSGYQAFLQKVNQIGSNGLHLPNEMAGDWQNGYNVRHKRYTNDFPNKGRSLLGWSGKCDDYRDVHPTGINKPVGRSSTILFPPMNEAVAYDTRGMTCETALRIVQDELDYARDEVGRLM